MVEVHCKKDWAYRTRFEIHLMRVKEVRVKQAYLVCYDISEPRLLKRVASYLETQGIRMQKSVFLLHLSQHKIKSVKATLAKMVEKDHHVMLIPLSPSALKKSEFLGTPQDRFHIF